MKLLPYLIGYDGTCERCGEHRHLGVGKLLAREHHWYCFECRLTARYAPWDFHK